MIETYIEGIFPRSDDLVMVWKRYDSGIVDEEEFRRRLEASLKKVIDLQIDSRLTYTHDPYIDWHDLFRPFTRLDGIESGPLTRYYENNVFYKKPVFKDEPIYSRGFLTQFLHKKYLPIDHSLILTLPGPYTFYKLSDFEGEVDPIQSIGNILKGAVEDAISLGFSYIILAEPEIAYSIDIDYDILKELYMRIKKYSDILWMHLFFGDILDRLDIIESLPISRYSIDTQYTNPLNMRCPKKNVTLGIIDGQNTLLEDIDGIVNMVSDFMETCSLKSVGLSNNVDLDFLPFNIAVDKVNRLGLVYRRLME